MRNLKRALSLALASVMLLSMTVIGAGALSFNDADDITNISAATVLEALEIMIGDEEGNFNPEDVVTRAEMATILCRVVYGVDYDAASYEGITTFTDIDGHWAECEIGMAYGEGWINGRDAATFDPDSTVATYEAALMLQRALGYYSSSDTTSYDLPTKATSLANQLGMFDGISSATYSGLTRDKVAVAVYNTMFECSPVAYSTFTTEYYVITPTGTDGEGYDDNGNTVSASIWTPSTSTYVDFGGKGTFAYDVHDVTLEEGIDVMGRPVDVILVDGDEVATSPIDYDAIFVDDTDYDDVIDGTYADDYEDGDKLTFVLNGKETQKYTDLFDADSDSDADYDEDETHYGLVVEVYDEYDADGSADANGTLLVAYYYYVDEISSIDYDDDDEITTIKMSNTQIASKIYYDGDLTDEFEEDDVVMYTVGYDSDDKVYYIDYIDFAEAVEGEVTGVSSGDTYFYLDSTKYINSVKYIAVDDEDLEVDDEAALYLSPYGYVVGTAIIEATETAYDYLYIEDDASTGGVSSNVEAEVYFADGTSAIITISELDDTDIGDVTFKTTYGMTNEDYDNDYLWTISRVWSFDIDSDGYYELSLVTKDDADAGYTVSQDATYTIEGGYTRLTDDFDGSTKSTYFGTNVYFTDDTVFVDTEDGVTYVGYENVADISVGNAGDIVAVYDDGDVIVVFIIDGSASSDAGTYVYLDGTGYYTTTIDGDKYYVYTSAYVDGENVDVISEIDYAYYNKSVTTAKKYISDLGTGIYEIETDSDGYVTKWITMDGDISDSIAYYELVKSVGSSSFTVEDGATRYEYDSDTIFVFIDADGDIYSGSKSDIETASNTTDDDYTAVEVIYDDDDDYAIVVFIYEKEVD